MPEEVKSVESTDLDFGELLGFNRVVRSVSDDAELAAALDANFNKAGEIPSSE